MLGDKLGDNDADGLTEVDVLGEILGDIDGLIDGEIDKEILGDIDGLKLSDGETEGDML